MSHADSPQNLGVEVRWPAKSPRLSDASCREAEEPHPQSQQKSWQHLLSLVSHAYAHHHEASRPPETKVCLVDALHQQQRWALPLNTAPHAEQREPRHRRAQPDGQHSLAELAEERGPWQPHV